MQADLIVIGAGFGGLTTGVRASELGLKPIVIEQGEPGEYACNSRYSGGHLAICMDDPASDELAIAERILRTTGNFADAGFARTYASTARPMLDWLRKQGANFIRIGNDPGRQWILAPPRRGQPGLDWKGRGPDVLLNTLTRTLSVLGGQLLHSTRAEELIFEHGRCAGVIASQRGDRVELRARSVVIADGGFQSDENLVRRYITGRPERVFQRNARTSTGMGLRLPEAINVKLVGMNRFYGHPLSRDAFTNEKLWPHPYLDVMTVNGIVVNANGRRFVDEGKGGVYLANTLANRDDPLDAYVVFDDNVWRGPAADISLAPVPNPTLKQAGATIHQADTIQHLAQQAGIDSAELVKTVEEFNRALEQQATATLHPPRTVRRPHYPIIKPPFFALPMCAGLTYTMGGPAVDVDGRVLNASDTPVDGLYAVGSATGGLEGGPDAGYVGGLAKAFILGLRAAQHIAQTR